MSSEPSSSPGAGLPPASEGSIAGDSFLLLGAQICGNAGFFVAVLIIARSLGPEGRGDIAFLTVSALIVARTCKLGLSESTTVFVARRPADRSVLLSNLLVSSIVVTSIGGALVAGLLLLLPGLVPAGLTADHLAIFVCGAVASSLWDESFLLGCRRLRRLSLRIATGGWIYALTLTAIAVGPGLTVTSVAIGWVLSHLLMALWLHLGPLRELGLARPSLGLLRLSLRFGFRAWLGSLSTRLNARMDQVLMGLITTEAALGIYAIAVNASEILLYLPSAIATALLPRLAPVEREDAGERTLRAFRMTLIVAMVTVAAAAVLGPVLVPLAFGPGFRASVDPFLWLLPGVVGYAAMSIFTSALLAMSAPGRSSIGPTTALVSGLLLDVALIPRFGATGAAVAASSAFLIAGLASLMLFRGHCPFRWSSLAPRPGDATALARLPAQLLAR